MDIDWVVGGCMSIDPDERPGSASASNATTRRRPNRQRATQILQKVAQRRSVRHRLGYAYDQRQFTVCVEDVS